MNKNSLVFSICFLALACTQVNASSLTHPLSRLWINTCRVFYCELPLNLCVQFGCLGKDNCTNCINQNFGECSTCAREIFDTNFAVTVGGSSTIFCDDRDSLQRAACSFYCRSNNKPNFRCAQSNMTPVCECLDGSATTVKPTQPLLESPYSNKKSLFCENRVNT